MTNAIYQSDIPGLKLVNNGKVRDIYEVDDNHLLIITTDRLSAFDVILPQAIPGKGGVLTRVANFWFDRTKTLLPNHISDMPLSDVIPDKAKRDELGDRALIVKKLKPLPVEAIVRGYLIGSGWKDYQKTGHVCGHKLEDGLEMAQQLPSALYTPSTKAAMGDHDENIDFDATVELLGQELAEQVRDMSLKIYTEAAEFALTKGIIIADTKFEFGLDDNGVLHLIDEVLTPDSSRFWAAESYQTNISPASFDKQIIRDFLETLDWDKTEPGPQLPDEIINKTAEKYREAELILTGK